MEILCRNLKLSIIREDFEDTGTEEIVRLELKDDLAMSAVEICYTINQSNVQSRRYHVKEALVIGLRRLIEEAIAQEMIKISASRGESTRSNTARGDSKSTRSTTPTTS